MPGCSRAGRPPFAAASLLLVNDLDETHLQAALQRLNGKWRGRQLRFHFKVEGRFDAALVPIGPTGELPDRWLLAIEEQLAIRDQGALYAPALGHLLLNNEQIKPAAWHWTFDLIAVCICCDVSRFGDLHKRPPTVSVDICSGSCLSAFLSTFSFWWNKDKQSGLPCPVAKKVVSE